MRKIGIYVRVSTKEAALRKEGSIKAQIHRIESKVRDKNSYSDEPWGKIVEVYKDEAKSGATTDRPEYQRMIQDIDSGKIDTVIVTELSRLSRSVVDFLSLIKFMKEKGADFICLQLDIDTTSPVGNLIATILASLFEFERALTIERQKVNNWSRAIRGLLNGGSPFLGYNPDPDKQGSLIIDLEEAEIVKFAFEAYAENKDRTLAEVSKMLNEHGYCNKQWKTKSGQLRGGGPFNRNSLYNILNRVAYLGKREVNEKNKEMDQSKLKDEEKYQIVSAPWPAIINQDLFDKVQEKLKENREGGRDRAEKNYDYFLTGVLFCDECGRPLVGDTSHGARRAHYYYSHSPTKKSDCKIKRYRAEELETLIKKEMGKVIGTEISLDSFAEKMWEEINSEIGLVDRMMASVKREVEEHETKKNNLLKILSSYDGASDVTSIVEELKRVEEKLNALEDKKEDLKIQRMKIKAGAADKKHIQESVKKFISKGFDKKDLVDKRDIVKGLFESIRIHPDNVIQLNVWSSKHHPVNTNQRSSQIQKHSVFASAGEGASAPFTPEGVIIPFESKAQCGTGMALETGEISGGLRAQKNPIGPTPDSLARTGTDGVLCSDSVKNGRADWI